MDNPLIIHAYSRIILEQTDIGFVTKWNAIEIERFLTRLLAEGFIPHDAGDDRRSDMSDCTDMELIDDETGSGDIICDID